MSRAGDIEALAAMRMARMSPASIAMTLGRSAAWVKRESEALDAAAEAAPEPAAIVEAPAVPAAPVPEGLAEPSPRAETVSRPRPSASPRSGLRALTRSQPEAASPPSPSGTTSAAAPARMSSARVVRLKPLSERIVRWALWFTAAGWAVEEVADLFDVRGEQLAAVVGGGAA